MISIHPSLIDQVSFAASFSIHIDWSDLRVHHLELIPNALLDRLLAAQVSALFHLMAPSLTSRMEAAWLLPGLLLCGSSTSRL